jgi:hypothetical protein
VPPSEGAAARGGRWAGKAIVGYPSGDAIPDPHHRSFPMPAIDQLSETKACDLLARLFRSRGYTIARNIPFREYGVSFHIDGWDAKARVGFEFLTSEDEDHDDLSLEEYKTLMAAQQRGELALFVVDEVEPLSTADLTEMTEEFLEEMAEAVAARKAGRRRAKKKTAKRAAKKAAKKAAAKGSRKAAVKRPAKKRPAKKAAKQAQAATKKSAKKPAKKPAQKKPRRRG